LEIEQRFVVKFEGQTLQNELPHRRRRKPHEEKLCGFLRMKFGRISAYLNGLRVYACTGTAFSATLNKGSLNLFFLWGDTCIDKVL
jgi:hypothetical protein